MPLMLPRSGLHRSPKRYLRFNLGLYICGILKNVCADRELLRQIEEERNQGTVSHDNPCA